MGASTQVLEHLARYIRAVTGPALESTSAAAEIAVDSATNTLKFGAGGAVKEVVDLTATQTISGTKTFSGTTAFTGATAGVRQAVVVTLADTIAITAAMSGTVFIATKTSATQVFTLPAAVTAGLTYSFVCGAGSADGEIHIGVATGDAIVGKTSGAENGTGLISTTTTGLLKNTASGNVVGDTVTLVSDGLLSYYMVSVAGAWTVT